MRGAADVSVPLQYLLRRDVGAVVKQGGIVQDGLQILWYLVSW